MISGCEDCQTSADVNNVSSFQLPDPAGRSGGACTSSFLKILYDEHRKTRDILSFQDVLMKMRGVLSKGRYTQVPQLSSSRPLDIQQEFTLVPPDCEQGTRRAVMIGINYVGKQGQLSGCHNDVVNMKRYIMDVWGFEEQNITILMDDGKHTEPTRDNILSAFRQLVDDCAPGDAAFVHYSGHGSKVVDDNGDEADGYDETIVPVDYATSSQIRDDDLFKILVGPLSAGVTMTCMMDCCHSGTVLDLPYIFVADGESTEMKLDENFNFGPFLQLAIDIAQGRSLNQQTVESIIAMVIRWMTGKAHKDQDMSAIVRAIAAMVVAYLPQLISFVSAKRKEAADANKKKKN